MTLNDMKSNVNVLFFVLKEGKKGDKGDSNIRMSFTFAKIKCDLGPTYVDSKKFSMYFNVNVKEKNCMN